MKLITLPLGLLLWAISTTGYSAVTFYTDLATFNGVTSTTVVEDFESVIPKDTALVSFSSNGITYTGIDSTPSNPNVWVASSGYTNFGVPITTSSVLTATGDEDFKLDFSMAVTELGFDTYLNGLGLAVVEVFGVGGSLGTYNPNHLATTIGFLGITSTENITSLRWTTTGGRSVNTGIDNIRINAVPIPAAAFMFAPALLGFLGLRRRAKNTIA